MGGIFGISDQDQVLVSFPARQAYWNKDVCQHHGASIFSQMAYATLEGLALFEMVNASLKGTHARFLISGCLRRHLISGEERFLVAWDGREAGPASGDGAGAVHFSVR